MHSNQSMGTLSSSLQGILLHLGAIQNGPLGWSMISNFDVWIMCCVWKYFGFLHFYICWSMLNYA